MWRCVHVRSPNLGSIRFPPNRMGDAAKRGPHVTQIKRACSEGRRQRGLAALWRWLNGTVALRLAVVWSVSRDQWGLIAGSWGRCRCVVGESVISARD